MAKKKRHSNQPAPFISQRKIRRWLFRLSLVALAAAAVLMVKPDLVKDPTQRAQVEDIRTQVLQANTQGQEKALEILSQGSQVTGQLLGQATTAAKELTHQDPQEIINTTITNLTNEVKDLPQEQVKKVKLQICEQILKDVDTSE